MRQGQSEVEEQSLPHGLSAAAVNFYLASGKGNLQKYVDRMGGWGPGSHQPASVPVYGPSKAPRLPQFVDMTTDKGGMTPFFSLDTDTTTGTTGNHAMGYAEEATEGEEEKVDVCMHSVHGQETNEEHSITEHHAAHVYLPMNTPQQQKQSVHISLGMNTPSSAMGMTLSPATINRSVYHATPCSTTACSNVHMGIGTHAIPRNLNAVTMLGGSNFLATELESAFAEHNKNMNHEAKHNHEEEVEMSHCTAHAEKPQNKAEKSFDSKLLQTSDAGCDDASTQRCNKEKRRGKSKNTNSQPLPQRQGTNTSIQKTATRSAVKSVVLHEKPLPTKDNKKFRLRLQCHGDRTNMVFSGMELHPGDFVIFEADRGVDLGEVVHCEETAKETSTDAAADVTSTAGGCGAKDIGRGSGALVVRRATPEEVEDWKGSLVAKEEEAVVECRAACEELGLTIQVVGAAYQFDRQKLIFLYESDERVDFRSLLQVMFSKFRCRIWMERLNATV